MSIDEKLLAEIDTEPEVQRDGRSAVIRRAVAAYLRERRASKIAESYRRAYGQDGGLGAEYSGWEDQGQWPED